MMATISECTSWDCKCTFSFNVKRVSYFLYQSTYLQSWSSALKDSSILQYAGMIFYIKY